MFSSNLYDLFSQKRNTTIRIQLPEVGIDLPEIKLSPEMKIFDDPWKEEEDLCEISPASRPSLNNGLISFVGLHKAQYL